MQQSSKRAKSLIVAMAALLREHNIPQKEIMAAFEDNSVPVGKPTLAGWLQSLEQHYGKFNRRQLDIIEQLYANMSARYETDSRRRLEGVDGALFYAVLERFDVIRMEELDLRRRLPGVYLLFRPSVVSPGYTLLNYAKISYDPTTHVVTLSERHHVEGQRSGYMDDDGFYYEGELCCKKGRFFSIQKDHGTGFPRFTILDEVYERRDRVTQLAGVTTGTLGPSVYTSPVYLERWESDAASFEDLCVETKERGGKEQRLLGISKTSHLNPRVQQVLRNILGNAMVLWEDHPQRAHHAPEWVS